MHQNLNIIPVVNTDRQYILVFLVLTNILLSYHCLYWGLLLSIWEFNMRGIRNIMIILSTFQMVLEDLKNGNRKEKRISLAVIDWYDMYSEATF